MDDLTVPAETPCAACGEPIGPSPWKQDEGRVYHEGCPVTKSESPRGLPGRGLGEKAEQAARRVLNPGQETLDG